LERGDGTSLLGVEENEYPIRMVLSGRSLPQKGKPTFIVPDHLTASPPDPANMDKANLEKALEVLRQTADTDSSPNTKPVSE
jgi:hypothetical protein